MPVHSVIVINAEGIVVFSKYFMLGSSHGGGKPHQEQLLFEQQLFQSTSRIWTAKAITSIIQTVTLGDVHVVFQRLGELLVFVCGVDDMDEVILSEIMDTFRHVLHELSGGKLTEQVFMNPENYGKWIISVDEMVPQGILETTDVELIDKLGKVRNL